MSAQDININRDLENDVLYVIKKSADKATTINIGATADVLLRLDRKTHKVVGLTIEDFSKVFPRLKDYNDWALMDHFDEEIELLNASHLALSKV